LRGARRIVLLYLFIVQGEGVCLDLFIFIPFTLEGEGGSWVFFNIYVEGGWEGEGVDFF
jgi:hypothetical protein